MGTSKGKKGFVLHWTGAIVYHGNCFIFSRLTADDQDLDFACVQEVGMRILLSGIRIVRLYYLWWLTENGCFSMGTR
jgi:hypothetical protein